MWRSLISSLIKDNYKNPVINRRKLQSKKKRKQVSLCLSIAGKKQYHEKLLKFALFPIPSFIEHMYSSEGSGMAVACKNWSIYSFY